VACVRDSTLWPTSNFASTFLRALARAFYSLQNSTNWLSSGYIPHNGVATFDQLVNASITRKLQPTNTKLLQLFSLIFKVFNTANDTANLLAAYGVAMSGSGDVEHMSIGGPPGDLAPITEQLRRKVDGLAASHGAFEADASPTRGDLYEL
jgi:hypothetical protein